tara:strand:- start:182 stop:349 length:168 start_codon:yes stop_codon:yes gene_type:complete
MSRLITDITNALYELEEWKEIEEIEKWEHVYKGLQALPNHIVFMIAKECGIKIKK